MSYEGNRHKEDVLRRRKMVEMLQAHIAEKERKKKEITRMLHRDPEPTVKKAKPVRIVNLGGEKFVEMDNGAVFNCDIYAKHGQLYLQILDNGKAKQTLSVSIEMVQELYSEKI